MQNTVFAGMALAVRWLCFSHEGIKSALLVNVVAATGCLLHQLVRSHCLL
jgi:hypothetical protein